MSLHKAIIPGSTMPPMEHVRAMEASTDFGERDDVEMVGLVTHRKPRKTGDDGKAESSASERSSTPTMGIATRGRGPGCWLVNAAAVGLAASAGYACGIARRREAASDPFRDSKRAGEHQRVPSELAGPRFYECPAEIARAENDKLGNFEFYLESNRDGGVDDAILNVKDDEAFRETVPDGWATTYSKLKDAKVDWTLQSFLPSLRPGDSIYESACGVGFNLLMTLEILAERANLTGLRAYGSDYVPQSVAEARATLERHAPNGTAVGNVCRGDSTNLSFVPSDSFDLAFTGYIDPLMDPLGLIPDDNDEEACWDQSIDFCASKDPGGIVMAKREQEAQEEWFALWVSELIRIVKPGGVVIIEEVAKPICDILADWGGVSKDWWKESVPKYSWNVVVDSIYMSPSRQSRKSKSGRYNVAMTKKY